METIQHLVAERAALSPDKEALVEGSQRCSFREFSERINQFAHFLIRHGVQKGDRIGILANTSTSYPTAMMSILKVGAVVVPLSTSMTSYELDNVIDSGELKALLYHDEFSSVLLSSKQLHRLSFQLKLEQGALFTCQFADELTSDPVLNYIVEADDTALMMFTSGTTGHAKGCMISHGGIRRYLNKDQTKRHHITEDMRYLFIHPFFHMSSTNSLLHCIMTGISMVCSQETDPATILGLIEREQINVLLALPPALTYLIEELERKPRYDFPLKLALSGGTKVPKSLIEQFDYHGITLAQGYGSTEAWMISTWAPQMGWKKAGSAGKPIDGVEVKVVHSDTREEVPTGQIGEIVVRSPYLFKGYWQNEAATNRVLKDGWLSMGDAGRIDEDGFIYIEGRYKDVIVYGGDNIYPDQVEEVILGIDGVLEAALVGMPNDVWGEVPYAYVVKRPSSALTADDVVMHCKEKLASYKIPTVVFVPSLPKNSVGKIMKNEVKKSNLRCIK
ncbi:acyl--CoA ligase [Priestia megaterium]|nr:acyl--CoA ligase [Priestia megaterium]